MSSEPPASGEARGLAAARGSDRVLIVAGALLLVDGFLPWYSFGPVSTSGFSSGTLAVIAIVLGAGAGAVVALRLAGTNLQLGIPEDRLVRWLGRGGLACLALRFLNAPSLQTFGFYGAAALLTVIVWAATQPRGAELRPPSPAQVLATIRGGLGPGVLLGSAGAGALMWIPSHQISGAVGSALAMLLVMGGLRLADPLLVPLWRRMLAIPRGVRILIGLGLPILVSMSRIGASASGQELSRARSALLVSAAIAYVFMRPRESDREAKA